MPETITVSDRQKPVLSLWRRGSACCLLTLLLAFALRMLEWASWQNPEYRLGAEWLLATHDSYHWVAGAEDFGLAAGHPMSVMLKGMAALLHTAPANVAYWFPPVLASLVAGIVFAWVWALGSMEAGIAAGLLTALSPGFLGRTLLGYYDTDFVTLFFPLLMTLAPACWAMRHMLLPKMILRRLVLSSGFKTAERLLPTSAYADHSGNPLLWPWVLLLGASGILSWWAQEWHSVFPYLIRYNVGLLAFMSVVMAPRGRRQLLLLGTLAYAFPTLVGPFGLSATACVLFAGMKKGKKFRLFLCRPQTVAVFWICVAWLMLRGETMAALMRHVNAYLKPVGDIRNAGGSMLVYPSVAQSIIEVQDLSFTALFAYFHPWTEAAVAGLAGFLLVLARRPGALFLLPLAVLSLLSTKFGGRMVMFGAPIVAIGLSLSLYLLLQHLLGMRIAPAAVGALASLALTAVLVAPFAGMVQSMSQGPMINRRHAEALARVRNMTPEDAFLWIWWDWGYAAHHFAGRATVADGAQHAGPSLYLPAAVFATDNARFARQVIQYTAQTGNVPGKVFEGMDAVQAQALMDRLHSPQTPLIEASGRVFVLVSFEMLRLGFWISMFGNWNFVSGQGQGRALSIVPQSLAYHLESGAVRLEGSESAVYASSISVFDETGVTRRNYIQEWFEASPEASAEQQRRFLAERRNVNFFFNRITGEKLAMDEGLYNSLMVQLLLGDPQDLRFSPYFKLVYDNVFARIYEVL